MVPVEPVRWQTETRPAEARSADRLGSFAPVGGSPAHEASRRTAPRRPAAREVKGRGRAVGIWAPEVVGDREGPTGKARGDHTPPASPSRPLDRPFLRMPQWTLQPLGYSLSRRRSRIRMHTA